MSITDAKNERERRTNIRNRLTQFVGDMQGIRTRAIAASIIVESLTADFQNNPDDFAHIDDESKAVIIKHRTIVRNLVTALEDDDVAEDLDWKPSNA